VGPEPVTMIRRWKISLKNAVIRGVASCRSCVNRRFGGTSVYTRSTWRHIPEYDILRSHCRENLKSYKNLLVPAANQTAILRRSGSWHGVKPTELLWSLISVKTQNDKTLSLTVTVQTIPSFVSQFPLTYKY
jgi:hypothetical protein